MTVAFDTLRFLEKLITGGFEAPQAKAIAEAFAEATGQELATKSDLALLKSDLREMEARLTVRFGAMIAAGIAVLVAMLFFGY
ncbi:MAG: hypothetical protein FD153_1520 [Rhodospirillaceae bacterium]|nr:MAG: hypothetical protein FD153_1520 [Rhodospirillaceae bacterium]